MEVDLIAKRIVLELNQIIINNVNSNIDVTFQFIEGHTFLFIKINNGSTLKKIDLNIDRDMLSEFYLNLYQELKNNYLNSQVVSINIIENINLIYPDNPYLIVVLKELHQNKMNIEFKNYGLEKESIDTIKNDWIFLINEEKKNKKSI